MHILAYKSNDKYVKAEGIDIYMYVYVVFFAIVSGVRFGVGSDFYPYAWQFDKGMLQTNLDNRSSEFLWVYFVQYFNRLDLHYTIGMGLVGFIQFLFIYNAIKRWKNMLIYLPFVLFGGWFILSIWGGMRQMIVVCAFVYMSRWIFERKCIHYFSSILILHYIHNSALLLIPLYFIPANFTLSSKRNFCLLLFAACFILGQMPQFQNAIDFLTSFANVAGYDDYVGQIHAKLSGQDVETRAFGPTMLSYLLLCFSVIFYSPQLKERFSFSIPTFELWYCFSYIFSCGFFLFCNVSHIFLRPVSYFMMFLMLMITLLVIYFKENLEFYVNHYYVLLILNWIGLIWTLYRMSQTSTFDYISYKFFWNHSLYENIF